MYSVLYREGPLREVPLYVRLYSQLFVCYAKSSRMASFDFVTKVSVDLLVVPTMNL